MTTKTKSVTYRATRTSYPAAYAVQRDGQDVGTVEQYSRLTWAARHADGCVDLVKTVEAALATFGA